MTTIRTARKIRRETVSSPVTDYYKSLPILVAEKAPVVKFFSIRNILTGEHLGWNGCDERLDYGYLTSDINEMFTPISREVAEIELLKIPEEIRKDFVIVTWTMDW